MCGRFAQASAPQELADLFGLVELPPMEPVYNVAPGTSPAILRVDKNGIREMVRGSWGLVPFWVKKPESFKPFINARAETVTEKPSFRSAIKHGRCVVPVDGFYEWAPGTPHKIPVYFTAPDGGPLFLAGISESGKRDTFAILTREAEGPMLPVHDRQPVILNPEKILDWLSPDEKKKDELEGFFHDPWNGRIRGRQVSEFVNRPANQGPDCIRPVESGLLLE